MMLVDSASPSVDGIVITEQAARRELARRELARRHLVPFSEYVAPYYRAARHHHYVGELLELVETYIRTKGLTGISRLMIFEPPRHGKSEQVSRHFPAWLLGKLPDARVILTSYGADLASDNSRAARELVSGEAYANVFGSKGTVDAPVELAEDSRSVKAWDLASPHRGGVVSAGVGGGITGKGAHLLVIDDPFKNREEAENPTHREKVHNWYKSSAYTRLEDWGAVVVMHTRWHTDDLAGRLLKMMIEDGSPSGSLADQWVVVNLPDIWEEPGVPVGKSFQEFHDEMLAEGVWVEKEDPLGRRPGEALWPQKYSAEDLARIAVNIGNYDYRALYRQSPYSREGGLFKEEWITIVQVGPKPEEIVRRVRYWDKAASEDGDYTAGVLMTLLVDGSVLIEHVVRGQWTPGKRDAEMVKTAQLDLKRPGPRAVQWHQKDPASAGLDSAQATNKIFAKNGIEAHFEPMTGDKEVRAGPLSSAFEGGMVRLLKGSWNEAFKNELIAFPKGKYDDQVDAGSSAFTKLMGKKQLKEPKSFQG